MSNSKTIFASVIAIALLSGSGFAATASHSCTAQPKAIWLSKAKISSMIANEGFKIKTVGVKGSCYRMSGTSPAGKKVVAYFNPASGALAK